MIEWSPKHCDSSGKYADAPAHFLKVWRGLDLPRSALKHRNSALPKRRSWALITTARFTLKQLTIWLLSQEPNLISGFPSGKLTRLDVVNDSSGFDYLRGTNLWIHKYRVGIFTLNLFFRSWYFIINPLNLNDKGKITAPWNKSWQVLEWRLRRNNNGLLYSLLVFCLFVLFFSAVSESEPW